MKLTWVVSGPPSEVFTTKDIHMQSVWMKGNQEESRPEWTSARCYRPGKGDRMNFRRQGQDVALELWSLTKRISGDLDRTEEATSGLVNSGALHGREVGNSTFKH